MGMQKGFKRGPTIVARDCNTCGRQFQGHTRSKYCPECHPAERAKWDRHASVRTAQRRKADPIGERLKAERARYGLSEAEHLALLEVAQCAICGRAPEPMNAAGRRSLHIDHCHKTGRVRGVLCASCNRAIGMFGDDPEVLRRAADYLEEAP